MTRTIRMKDIAGLKANATTAPYATTDPAKIGGVRGVGSTPAAGTLIFEDNFDSHPDWTSDQLSGNINGTPSGWTVGRTDSQFGPNGQNPIAGRHPTAEILAANTDKTNGGAGKSYVMWREAIDTRNTSRAGFNSDALLLKDLGQEYSEIYMECDITFSNEMVASYYASGLGQSKMLRAQHVDTSKLASDPFYYFQNFNEDNSPKFLIDISGETDFGVRNFLALYAKGDNDMRASVKGLPTGAQLQGGGDVSLWYSETATAGLNPDGTDPQLTDYKNGGIIAGGPVDIDQVFGDETVWVKIGMYIKLNSSPGTADGVAMTWLNDKRTAYLYDIPWIRAGQELVGLNIVGIGGNDGFTSHSQQVSFDGTQTDITVTFAFTESLYIRDLTTNTEMSEGSDYTVSGSVVTILANAGKAGNLLVIYDGYQEWYAIDNFKVYNGIPADRGLV